MVTYVQNKKVTIIVDINNIGFNAHCMRPTRQQSAVHSHFALEKRYAFATSLRRFSQSGLKLFFLWVDCASFMCDWDKPRSTKTQQI